MRGDYFKFIPLGVLLAHHFHQHCFFIISDATQALLDMVATGIKANIDQAIKAANDARAVLVELARARASKVVNNWVALVNQGKGANMAFKSAVSRVIEELYPHKIGQKLTPLEAVSSRSRPFQYILAHS